jgi:hypothetical protein
VVDTLLARSLTEQLLESVVESAIPQALPENSFVATYGLCVYFIAEVTYADVNYYRGGLADSGRPNRPVVGLQVYDQPPRPTHSIKIVSGDQSSDATHRAATDSKSTSSWRLPDSDDDWFD